MPVSHPCSARWDYAWTCRRVGRAARTAAHTPPALRVPWVPIEARPCEVHSVAAAPTPAPYPCRPGPATVAGTVTGRPPELTRPWSRLPPRLRTVVGLPLGRELLQSPPAWSLPGACPADAASARSCSGGWDRRPPPRVSGQIKRRWSWGSRCRGTGGERDCCGSRRRRGRQPCRAGCIQWIPTRAMTSLGSSVSGSLPGWSWRPGRDPCGRRALAASLRGPGELGPRPPVMCSAAATPPALGRHRSANGCCPGVQHRRAARRAGHPRTGPAVAVVRS